MVVIEHDLDVMEIAHWTFDLGPEGGEIVAEGTPEQAAAEPRSFAGRYLAPLLGRGRAGEGENVAAE